MDKNYTYDDLLHNQDFIDWVKTGLNKEIDWEAWRAESENNRENASRAEAFIRSMRIQPGIEASEQDVEALWSKIEAKTNTVSVQPNKSTAKIRRFLPAAIAAAVALLLGFFMLVKSNEVVVTTGLAETTKVELPDGSLVTLNADSKVSYRKKDWEGDRRLRLEGEAFFEVKKGSSFTVETLHAQTKVLGTSFNVLDRGRNFAVHCYTGKVAVLSEDSKQLLEPGEQTTLRNNRLEKGTFETSRKTWREGYFEFVNAMLLEVFDEIERQFDVDIEALPEVLKMKYSGSFEANDLEKALHSVCWPMRLKSVQKDKRVMITKENE